MQLRRFWLVAVILLLLVWALPASAATVVTVPHGDTVTFCETRTQGTYLSGDPWIIGPVTICDRSKKDTVSDGIAINGCMVNPVPPSAASVTADLANRFHNQGWDNRVFGNTYSAANDWCDSYPSAEITAGSSIVFSVSLALNACTAKAAGGPRDYQCINYMDVVTVVSSDPGAVFRPAFTGTDKSYTPSASGIRYNVLKDHPLVTGQPTLATLEAEGIMRGPLIYLADDSQGWERLAPINPWNMIRSPGSPNSGAQAYGRAINWGITDVLGALHADYTDMQKQTMVYRLIQTAIDLYGQLGAGRDYYQAKGGFCFGHNTIMLTAASLLNYQPMMDAASIALNPGRYCHEYYWKYIEQIDIDTQRATFCGSNVTNSQTSGTECLPFTQAMLGRPQHCWNLNTWQFTNPYCTASYRAAYNWMNQGFVMQALSMRWMSLETEFGCVTASTGLCAFFDFLLSSGTSLNWTDHRWAEMVLTQQIGTDAPCSQSSNFQSSALRLFVCTLYTTYKNETPTDGSISGGSPSNNAPTTSQTSPSASTTHVTSSATIAFIGTSTDTDGTIASTVATSTLDASVTNSGTAAAWTRTVDLPVASVSTVTIIATDDDGATSDPIVNSVLRATNDCSGLADTFSLNGSWSTPNPNCWTNMTGALLWENNHLRSTATARNLFYYNNAINNDQQASVTLDVTPDASTWIYGLVRSSVSGGTYSGMSCTAQNPTSYIARFVNGSRQQIGAGFSTVASPWASGDVFGCRVIGQEVCILKNGSQIGADSCETDASAVFTSGFTGAGCWGTSCAFSNFVATSQAGGGDITNPMVAITTPPSILQVSATPYTAAAGTGSDAVGITECTWLIAENPGENGSCGNVSLPDTDIMWEIASIDLLSGNNTLQVRVEDAAGNNATASVVINYVPASSVVATFTYPNADAAWTQKGALVDLMGTFTMGECTSVLLTNVSSPDPGVGGYQVVATGADSWSARVRLIPGENSVIISCMDGASGTGTSLLDVTKTVTSVPNRKRR